MLSHNPYCIQWMPTLLDMQALLFNDNERAGLYLFLAKVLRDMIKELWLDGVLAQNNGQS